METDQKVTPQTRRTEIREKCMKHTGINMGRVKKQNRASILNYICETGPVSRKDIAEATGLTPAAVTQICTEFMEQKILFETGEIGESSGAGRKKILVDIDYNYAYIFGVNIEQENTTIALTNMKGDLKELETIKTQSYKSPQALLSQIANVCQQIIGRNIRLEKKIAGISVGITGIVDKETGNSIRAYGIWEEEVAVCEILEDKLRIPAIIENNVNAFATAELMYGLGKQYENLLVIKWGPGVGSTIVIDNKVYDGRKSKAAELGHFIIERDGQLCSCGRRGCLETKVSYPSMARQIPFDENEFGEAYEQALHNNQQKVFDEEIGRASCRERV